MYVQELTSPLCLWCIGEHYLYPGRLSISIQSIHVPRASGKALIDTPNSMFTGILMPLSSVKTINQKLFISTYFKLPKYIT